MWSWSSDPQRQFPKGQVHVTPAVDAHRATVRQTDHLPPAARAAGVRSVANVRTDRHQHVLGAELAHAAPDHAALRQAGRVTVDREVAIPAADRCRTVAAARLIEAVANL